MENYASKGVGFPEDGFLQALAAVTGSDFAEFYSNDGSEPAGAGLQTGIFKQAGLSIEVVQTVSYPVRRH